MVTQTINNQSQRTVYPGAKKQKKDFAECLQEQAYQQSTCLHVRFRSYVKISTRH